MYTKITIFFVLFKTMKPRGFKSLALEKTKGNVHLTGAKEKEGGHSLDKLLKLSLSGLCVYVCVS